MFYMTDTKKCMVNDMDRVQKFIEENQHQLGYIMDEASRRWIKNDPVGAFVIGGCKATVEAELIIKQHEDQYLQDTIDILYDYDGNRTVEGLKGLIDETIERLKTIRDHQTMTEDEFAASKVKHMIVDTRDNKVIFIGTLAACSGYMKSLHEDDSSNDGLWVWSVVIPTSNERKEHQ